MTLIAVGSTVVAFNFVPGAIGIRTVFTSINVMGAVVIGTNVVGTVFASAVVAVTWTSTPMSLVPLSLGLLC